MAALDHPAIVESVVWQQEAATEAFAHRLARALLSLQPAADALIELRGNLGAGKTTFVRHLLRAMGVTGRIKSPTYAVVETYLVGPDRSIAVSHFDFYRFNDPDEWEEAGFRDIFAAPGLKLVEWPDKAADRLPTPDLVLEIQSQSQNGVQSEVHDEDDTDGPRQVELRGYGPKGFALVSALA